jgi:hypothetical protein
MEANSNSSVSGKLVHIGAEVLVLISVVFYMNGQLKSMKNEIRELRAKLEDQTELSNKHLTKIYAMVDNLQNRPSFPSHLLGPSPFSLSSGSPEGNWHEHPSAHSVHSTHSAHPSQHPGHPRQVPIPVQIGLRQRHPKSGNVTEKPSNKSSNKPSQSSTNPRRPIANPKSEVRVEEVEEPELPDEDTLDEELKEELEQMEAMEAEENEDDDSENSNSENSRQSKETESPAQDLSFVQKAIRPTARKFQPIVKKTP